MEGRGEDLVDVGHLGGLDNDRFVDFVCGINLFLRCTAITLSTLLFLYRSILLVRIDGVSLVQIDFFVCGGVPWLVGCGA